MRPSRKLYFSASAGLLLIRAFAERAGDHEKAFLEFFADGYAEGVADSARDAVLLVLAERSLPMTAAERTRIKRCRDFDRLTEWLRRAVAAASVSEVLAAKASPERAAPRARRAGMKRVPRGTARSRRQNTK